MTREEYLQLLENSLTFKGLDAVAQDKIRSAVGEEMEENARGFQEDAEMLAKAYDKLNTKTDQIVIGLKHDVIKQKNEQMAKAEVSQRGQEISGAENLLKNI